MTKQKPAFDNVTKPGALFQTFKPNKAMQEQMQREMEELGYVYENGKIVAGPAGPGGKIVWVK